MDIKELRVGNLLYNGFNELIEVKNISHYNTSGFLLETLKPIELTYQWLDKLGFEFKDAGDFGHYYSLEDFDLNQDYQPINFDCDEIKYVHQLQNVYFALTGQELEIK
jgi:hypothetical protein